MRFSLSFFFTIVSTFGATLLAGPSFKISFDDATRKDAVSGRLVVYLLPGESRARPVDGVFYSDPRPILGKTVANLRPGEAVVIDDSADSFPALLSKLPPGKYTAQAVLDTNLLYSEWSDEPGNLFSDPAVINITTDGSPIELKLTQVTPAEKDQALPKNLELFSIRSKLLSDFTGREVKLNATVLLPTKIEAGKKYAALYRSPGFGGRHWDGIRSAGRRTPVALANPITAALAENMFEIFLDPESPNGHTFFLDSDVNGPWGRALTEELIPALEAKYPLASDPMARLLRGHSSGGWSTLWLATEYPNVFGATWSTAPDPVDFHRFESSDIYTQENFYRGKQPDGSERTFESFRKNGKVILRIEEENRMENVVGPRHSSGQQWAAWQSCWGRRAADGFAKHLWDPVTGKIDRDEAESYRRFDIVDRLKKNPQRFGPIFLQRVRLVVGDKDNFYLNEAVELLKPVVDALPADNLNEGRHGYIKIVPDLDHSTLFGSKETQNFPGEMLEHLRRHGFAPPPAATSPTK